MKNNQLIDLTNAEVVKNWMDGKTVWSAELGGLGPGYEQAIQDALFDLLTYWVLIERNPEDLLTDQRFNEVYDSDCHKIWAGRDLSGAMAVSAGHTAFRFLKYGYKYMMEKLESERAIQVNRSNNLLPVKA